MKITMIGISGSGKTTYMAALHEVLGINQVKNYFITPTAGDMTKGIKRFGQFGDLSFAKTDSNENIVYKFPEATSQTTFWSFDLLHNSLRNSQTVCNFEWIDYRGGLLQNIFTDLDHMPDDSRTRDLTAHISFSNAVFLFADSVMLTKTKNPSERKILTGARLINQWLRLFSVHYPNRNLTVMIILSKADSDLIEDEWKEDNYAKLVKAGSECFDEVVRLSHLSKPNWICGIVPIGAIGNGHLKSNIIKDKPLSINTAIIPYPDPMNIEHPLFFCLGQTLLKMRDTAALDIVDYQRRIEDIMKRSPLWQNILPVADRTQNPREITEQLILKVKQEHELLKLFVPHARQLIAYALEKVTVL